MRGKWWMAAGAALLVGLAVAAWAGRDAYAFARIGTTYAAKQTCSCLFVAGRTMESCKADYPPEQARLFSWAVSDGRVTVAVAGGLVTGVAQFEDGYGCRPVR